MGLVAVGCLRHHPPSTVASAPASVEVSASGSRPDAVAPAPAPGPPEQGPTPEALAALNAKRLDFRHGEPTVPVRLMENATEVRFKPRGRMHLTVGKQRVESPPGTLWRVRLVHGEPATVAVHVQLAELRHADKEGVKTEEALWRGRGFAVRTQTVGGVYGISGKVIDNRHYRVLLDESFATEAAAKQRQAELITTFGVRTQLFEQVTAPSTGELELLNAEGNPAATGAQMVAESEGAAGFDVERVEYGVGYDFHDFENRSYHGALDLRVDAHGKLAVINLVSLEDLLKGLVPSEIFSRAPAEALKAQAVTARGEVLAKIGTKHLADPYLLCSEQHCAVYKGLSGETAATNAAVDATRGEGLFDAEGRLVDSVYSAVCGGHTESNENVWGGPPNPSLRGVPDLLHALPGVPSPRENLSKFLATDMPAACQRSSFSQATKFRWTRQFSAAQLNGLTAALGLGPIHALKVLERGVSGRARLLTLAGELGATEIRGELNIRRQFGMLNSAMFVVTEEKDAHGQPVRWTFTGGGWGHGVGLCQTGAIGRAEAGQDYRSILKHYFSGAQVSQVY